MTPSAAMDDPQIDPVGGAREEPVGWEEVALEPTRSLAYRLGQKIGAVAAAVLGLIFVIIAVGAALAAIVFGVILVIKLLPAHVPEKRNPGYLDNVFANRWVVWAARLAALGFAVVAAFGSLYVCASIVMRMVKGHWLRSAGPFQAEVVEKVTEELNEAGDIWLNAWQESESRNTELSQHLEQATESIQWLVDRLNEAGFDWSAHQDATEAEESEDSA
jgi:hypothetical protein